MKAKRSNTMQSRSLLKSGSSLRRIVQEGEDWMQVLESMKSDQPDDIDVMLKRSSDVTNQIYSYSERRKRFLKSRGYGSDEEKESPRMRMLRRQKKLSSSNHSLVK